jgi:hypothetical protein
MPWDPTPAPPPLNNPTPALTNSAPPPPATAPPGKYTQRFSSQKATYSSLNSQV